MNKLVADGLLAGMAELERLVEPPTPPLGYGVDLHCTTDVTEDLAEVDPNSPEGIAEGIFRRWTCPRGQNPDDPNYGRSVYQLLNRGMTFADLAAEGGQLRAEAEKDERVDECEVKLVQTNGGRELRVTSKVTPNDPRLAEFRFTVAVTDGQALLEVTDGSRG